MNENTFYHLTSKRNVKSILKDGIEPEKGRNSLAVEEQRDGIFLCSRKDIGKWAILLGLDTLLCVDGNALDQGKLTSYSYSCYDEWIYGDTIPASAIMQVPMPERAEDDMSQLAMSTFLLVNQLVVDSVKFYDRIRPSSGGDVKAAEAGYGAELKSVLACAGRIDFRSVPQRQYREKLIERSENGEFMMTDRFKSTGLRLYELLADESRHRVFPQEEDAVYALIMSKWTKHTRSVHTGSWTD